MVQHSLVGYDGSDSAKRAVGFALDVARCGGGWVRVVMALQPTVADPAVMTSMMVDSGEPDAAQLAAELADLHPDAGRMLEVDVVRGRPGEVLLAQVEAHGIDHIVIGHTERGALARWLVGSVSTDVLARARVPVTVVR